MVFTFHLPDQQEDPGSSGLPEQCYAFVNLSLTLILAAIIDMTLTCLSVFCPNMSSYDMSLSINSFSTEMY